jgi:quinone-modifying oxidoreductase, subunit QmoC
MAALRDYSISHYAAPRVMGRALGEPRWLPLLFAIPAVIFLAILGGLGHLGALPEGRIVFSKFMPILFIEVTFVAAIALSLSCAALGGVRYWRAMSAGASAADWRHGWASLIGTLGEIFTHRRFHACTETPAGRRETHKEHLHYTHLAVFYGFLGLVVTTASVGIGIYAFGYLTPWPVWHPVKILGNVSGLAVIVAVALFLWRRIIDAREAGKSTYSDWLFLSVLGVTTLTGFLSQWLRLAGLRAAYLMYIVHLLFIFFLVVYIPYSKFAHLIYRTLAMLHSASRGAGSAGTR